VSLPGRVAGAKQLNFARTIIDFEDWPAFAFI
jgi:hypothetical protein